jgi:hypothetical protein
MVAQRSGRAGRVRRGRRTPNGTRTTLVPSTRLTPPLGAEGWSPVPLPLPFMVPCNEWLQFRLSDHQDRKMGKQGHDAP